MKLQPPHSTVVDASARGLAPWLTMVHAASHDQRYFSRQIQAFQRQFRVLLIDLPGHGKSAALPGPYGLEEHALGVLAAMDAAGVEESHYLGSHTGAAVGIMLASRHRQRIKSLTLESAPIPGVDLASVVETLGRARATARSHGVEAARREWFEHGPWFQNIRNNPQRCRAAEHWKMVADFSGQPWLDTTPAAPVTAHLDELSSIRCPVLMVNGEHDVEDFLHAADQLQRRLPRAQRVRIAEAGGFAMWEAPAPVNAHIQRHLENSSVNA